MNRSWLIIALLAGIGTSGTCPAATSYEEVRASYASSDAVLLDRHGEVIHELRVDPHGRRLAWKKLSDISPALEKAVIRSEDKRFYDHYGVDWIAVLSAALGNLVSDARRGASTITMQVASMLDAERLAGAGRRTFGQKWKQMSAARELERTWNKGQVLEAYLNLASFRGELQGVAAASRGLFDKDPGGLDEAEASILAAMLRSPNAAPERVGERAALLAASLGFSIPPAHIRTLAVERLSRPYTVNKRIALAPHVARQLTRKGRERARSTLDERVQRFSADALAGVVAGLTGQNVSDGAVLVADNRSGDVLAYVGNSGSFSSAPYVDGIRARRQAGSTLKPFLYGFIIEKRILTAASLIEDTSLDLPTGRGVYRPANYDRSFHGLVSARTALASSMNIPAVRTLSLAGTDTFVRTLRGFGFTGLAEPDFYGPSLALGSADITLWDLVNAYRTLANGGVWSQLRLSSEGTAGARRRVLSPDTSFIISDILADREARSTTFSLESPLATRFWTAVKTGTSKDMRDNWCVGYSDRYTVGVWVGNFSGASMWDVSGISGAAPIWLEVMNQLHADISSNPPDPPAGVVPVMVWSSSGEGGTSRREWFLAGTEHATVRPLAADVLPKIVYPAPGTVIAIDPDIPADLQKVFFRATTSDALLLDGKRIDAFWSPVPGIHHLILVGVDGAVADRLSFEVR